MRQHDGGGARPCLRAALIKTKQTTPHLQPFAAPAVPRAAPAPPSAAPAALDSEPEPPRARHAPTTTPHPLAAARRGGGGAGQRVGVTAAGLPASLLCPHWPARPSIPTVGTGGLQRGRPCVQAPRDHSLSHCPHLQQRALDLLVLQLLRELLVAAVGVCQLHSRIINVPLRGGGRWGGAAV